MPADCRWRQVAAGEYLFGLSFTRKMIDAMNVAEPAPLPGSKRVALIPVGPAHTHGDTIQI
ncbi:MAG: hypothetical protein JRI38_06380 [Deltaproteobacteria bacterium]|nr:hypothetical protein [Deltaproteobacteria bacterium]